MSDGAFDALDRAGTEDDYYCSYSSGTMIDAEAYELRVLDDYVMFRNKSVKCKFCGESSLSWIKLSDGIWRLQDKNKQIHSCLKYRG